MSFNADDSVIKNDLVVADDSVGIADLVVADNPVVSDDLVVADGASATMSTKPNIRAAIQTVFKVRKTIGILLDAVDMGPS